MDRSDRFARDEAWNYMLSEGSNTAMDQEWISGDEFFADYDSDETEYMEPEEDGEGDRQRAIDICSEMIRDLPNISLDDIRERCIDIEVMESNPRRLQARFDAMISEYISSNNIVGNYPYTFSVTRGNELAHMFKQYTRTTINPTSYPIDRHMVVYVNEPGVDGGGLRTEFFNEVCSQLKDLFGYINPESNNPRMYISTDPDTELIDRINTYGGKFKENGVDLEPFTVDDLPKLYELAGAMCQHATISKYSTGIPLSRALLTAMTSTDTGVTEIQLGTIYLIEAYTGTRDEVRVVAQTSEYMEEPFLETLISRSRGVYLLDNHLKSGYISDLINGFRISPLLSSYWVSPGDLHDVIGGSIFSKDVYERWWRSESNVTFPNRSIREKFLELHLGHDRELIQYMRDTKPEMSDMTDERILERYHQNVLRGITSVPTPSRHLKVFVVAADVNGMFPHSCCNTLDVNVDWLMSTSFSAGEIPWVVQVDATFMTRGYTRA